MHRVYRQYRRLLQENPKASGSVPLDLDKDVIFTLVPNNTEFHFLHRSKVSGMLLSCSHTRMAIHEFVIMASSTQKNAPDSEARFGAVHNNIKVAVPDSQHERSMASR